MGTRSCRIYTCDLCGKQVKICSHCDRGNRYCGKACRSLARHRSKREAGVRYQRTDVGRRNQRRRQERYRAKKAARSTSTAVTSKVTHHGSPSSPIPVPPPADLLETPLPTPATQDQVWIGEPPTGSLRCSTCGWQVSEHVRVSFLSGEDPG